MSGVAAEPSRTSALGTALRVVGRARDAHLDDLGEMPDWVTPDARGAMLNYAQGGKRRLHMLLATALFLAEKEHLANIDLALVQRAASLQLQTEAVLPQPAAQPSPSHHKFWLIAVPLVIIAALATHQLLRAPRVTDVAEMVAPAIVTKRPAVPLQHAAVAVAPPVVPAPAPPAPAWQPVDPAPNLVLRFTAASQAHAQLVSSSLIANGFTVTALQDNAPRRAASVRYFYAEDRAAAERVARATLPADVVPKLALVARGRPAVPPGTVELYFP